MNRSPEARRIVARKKLLSLIPRARLESLALCDRPWVLERSELIERATTDDKWDEDRVERIIKDIFRAARNPSDSR